MVIHETDLPGVGKKFEVDLEDDTQLVIVIHNTGKRELFLRATPDADSDKLFELSDKMARQVGTIMEGAYFQPIRDDTVSTVLGEDTLIEWAKVTDRSSLVGDTLRESNIRQKTGASIVAIQRGDDTIDNPGPEISIQQGDTLVALGDRESHRKLERFASGDNDVEEQLNDDE